MNLFIGFAAAAFLPSILIAVVIFRVLRPRRVVVLSYQRALLFRSGRLQGVLEPGAYWAFARTSITLVDLRLQTFVVPGQEILTADGITLKISLAGEYQVVDPERFVTVSVAAPTSLYLYAQQAVRTVAAELTFEAILAARPALNQRIAELTGEQAATLGLRVQRLDIRDLMLPNEVRRAFTETVAAQKQGMAALERARAETASLRSLANAARILESSPALLQLRALQTVEASKGSTIVLGVPADLASLRKSE